MMLNDYQAYADKYAIYPKEEGVHYCMHGLCSETGEVADKIKKAMRDGWEKGHLREEVRKELGDVLWYIAMMCKEFDLRLMDVATNNLIKLEDRRMRSKLGGSGDER